MMVWCGETVAVVVATQFSTFLISFFATPPLEKMSSFIPLDEELFPVHELCEDVLFDAVNDNLLAILGDELPTEFDRLERWMFENEAGILIKELPIAVGHMDVLAKALRTFGDDAKYLFDLFLDILEKVGSWLSCLSCMLQI
jgi:hypothetical protein